MDWTLAIDRNRQDLLRIVAMLFAAMGLVAGGSVAVLPRRVRCMALRVLRSASSAARRLIVVAARDLVVAPCPKRPAPASPIPRGQGERLPTFPLFDPRNRVGPKARRKVAGPGPRLSIPGFDDPVFEDATEAQAVSPEDEVSAVQLCRRVHSLKNVLENLSRHARRLARLRAREAKAPRRALMRPGRPPGHRARAVHPVDWVLRECHALALLAVKPPDTS